MTRNRLMLVAFVLVILVAAAVALSPKADCSTLTRREVVELVSQRDVDLDPKFTGGQPPAGIHIEALHSKVMPSFKANVVFANGRNATLAIYADCYSKWFYD